MKIRYLLIALLAINNSYASDFIDFDPFGDEPKHEVITHVNPKLRYIKKQRKISSCRRQYHLNVDQDKLYVMSSRKNFKNLHMEEVRRYNFDFARLYHKAHAHGCHVYQRNGLYASTI